MNAANNSFTAECPKCSGAGRIEGFSNYANGRCFDCNGAGVITGQAAENAVSDLEYRMAAAACEDWDGVYTSEDHIKTLCVALKALNDKAVAAGLLNLYGINRAELVAAYKKCMA